MENHWVLRLWLCCGGGSNWLKVPVVLAQLHCFNHDMSMLLPGKLWIQFWPLCLLCCLFLGVLPIYIAPQKSAQNILIVMQPRKGDSQMENLTHHLILQGIPQSPLLNRNLRQCGFNQPPFCCRSSNTFYRAFPFQALPLFLCWCW